MLVESSNEPNGAESEGYQSQSNERDLRIDLTTRAVGMQGTAMSCKVLNDTTDNLNSRYNARMDCRVVMFTSKQLLFGGGTKQSFAT